MKLTIKTISNKVYNVEAEPQDTVQILKQKIEKEFGAEFPVAGQKLVFSGKVLKDDVTLEEYKIDENGFLVIIVSKPPKIISSAEKTTSADLVGTEPKKVQQTADTETADQKKNDKPNPKNDKSTSADKSTASSSTKNAADIATSDTGSTTSADIILSETELEKVTRNLTSMGFTADQVKLALRASFNNPDRAVEYLVTGIPPSLVDSLAATQTSADMQSQQLTTEGQEGEPTSQIASGDEHEDETVDDVETDPLGFLRQLPQFRQMRELVQSNPNLLQLFIQQLGAQNPELLQLFIQQLGAQLGAQNPELLQRITENQERFIQMLNEPIESGTDSSDPGHVTPQSAGLGNTQVAPPNTIRITVQEKEAIERLKAMGFPEALVVQAYFACEKDENAAANFLLTQNNFDEE